MAADAMQLETPELEEAFAALEAAQPLAPAQAPDPIVEATAAAVRAAVAGALQGVLTATAQQAARSAEAARPAGGARLLGAYTRYLALFVGAGLIAGAVVHFPLAPGRYAAMGVVGAAVFAAGSIGDDLGRRTTADRVTHLMSSLVVALAVGMVAGGIQHFSDVPGRAAVLIPFGLAVGLAAFAVRDGFRLASRDLAIVGAVVAAAAILLGLGLHGLAGSTAAPAGDQAHGAAGAHAH